MYRSSKNIGRLKGTYYIGVTSLHHWDTWGFTWVRASLFHYYWAGMVAHHAIGSFYSRTLLPTLCKWDGWTQLCVVWWVRCVYRVCNGLSWVGSVSAVVVLLLLLFARRRGGEKKEPLLQDTDIRDNIFYYDEEGGGEDDQVQTVDRILGYKSFCMWTLSTD